MNSKPILFNNEMVKAILEGRKTQTRRLIKNNKKGGLLENRGYFYRDKFSYTATNNFDDFGKNKIIKLCSKYQTGDVLYVKETFGYRSDIETFGVTYKADWRIPNKLIDFIKPKKWKPSIHMPEKYARIFLKVTNVRVERLQDMKNNDYLAECVNKNLTYKDLAKKYPFYIGKYSVDKIRFIELWDLTAKAGYKWGDNPYVFVYEFERIEKRESR